MSTYQGPHVAVTQVFEQSPVAIAIEQLPSVDVGTAYDVFAKESLGDPAVGILANTHDWTLGAATDKVVYDVTNFNDNDYNFYPVVVRAKTSFPQLGDVVIPELSANYTVDSTGVSITKDSKYDVLEVAVGSSTAIMPYYNKTTTVVISASDTSKVIVTGGAFVQAKLKPGQDVFVKDTTWKSVGTVQSIKDGEIQLTSAYGSAIVAGTDIIVGVSTEMVAANAAASTTFNTKPNCIYDSSKDFVALGIKEGDVIAITSDGLSSAITMASITNVTENLLKINTGTWDTFLDTPALAANIEGNFYRYKGSSSTAGGTPIVSTYTISRFIGYSQLYRDANMITTDGTEDAVLTVTKVGTTSFSTVAASSTLLSVGDYIAVTTTAAAVPVSVHKIISVDAGSPYIYVTADAVTDQLGGAMATGNYLWAWSPKLTSEVLVDYRAIRMTENGVIKRIGSRDDITAAWGTIGIYNDLAYMANITLGTNGGRVLYGVNVDSSATDLAAEYAAALEELKLVDVYSHAFGTTDAGVNALIGPYCDEQSDPYEGHERIGITTYDTNDIFEQGRDTGTVAVTTGILTISGAINLVSSGVTVGDTVDQYTTSTGAYVATFDIAATPTAPNTVALDTVLAIGAGSTFVFKSGRKSDQANRISAIGGDNRRVTAIYPGWFTGKVGNSTLSLPPYYISAAIVGMDCLQIQSQSFTNMDFAIPGISNISLNTNTYFRKAQLDTVASGGVDILIQNVSPSSFIKSRHDLTTNMDAIEFRERSITKQADVAAKTARAGVAPYIGKYNISDELFKFLNTILGNVSKVLKKNGTVKSFQTLSIQKDPDIIDKINFQCKVTVFVAGNYYDITLFVVS